MDYNSLIACKTYLSNNKSKEYRVTNNRVLNVTKATEMELFDSKLSLSNSIMRDAKEKKEYLLRVALNSFKLINLWPSTHAHYPYIDYFAHITPHMLIFAEGGKPA